MNTASITIRTEPEVKEQLAQIPTPYLLKSIKQARKEWEKGNVSPKFKNAHDFVAYLHEQTAK